MMGENTKNEISYPGVVGVIDVIAIRDSPDWPVRHLDPVRLAL